MKGSPKTTMITTNHNGAVAVEFTIIFPLLLLVTFGIIELGLLLFNQQIITNAAREGARAGIVSRQERFQDADTVDVEAVVNSWLANNLITFGDTNMTPPRVEIIDRSTGNFAIWNTIVDDPDEPDDGPCNDFECPLRVTVTYNYEFLVLSIPLRFFGFGPRTLVARSVMRME